MAALLAGGAICGGAARAQAPLPQAPLPQAPLPQAPLPQAQAPLPPAPLPATGTTLQPGLLRQQLEGILAPGAGTPTAPAWTIVPSLEVQQGWTDESRPGDARSGSAFITVVRPGLLVNGDSSRIHATLSYAPDLQVSTDGSQDRIGHNLNGLAQITLVPEHAFLDLRGFAAVQSSSGGYGPRGTVSLGNRNATQVSSFSATPYVRQRFGEFGWAELGASFAHTALDSLDHGGARPRGADRDQFANTVREYFSFTSGPDFGRFSTAALASAMQSDGNGVMRGARREVFTVDNGYAISRNLIGLAKLGYESLRYGGVPGYRFDGPLWNAGLRWLPNADSSIELRYGEREGKPAAELDAAYAPSVRTRIFARYSEGLSTEQEDLQNAISESTLDPLGNPVDRRSGAPLLLVSDFYGVQDNLARVKRASLTGMVLFDRDTVSLTVSYQDRRQLSAASAAAAGDFTSTGTYGSINWQHDFGYALTGIGFLQYGVARNLGPGNGTSHPLVLSLGLNYALSSTLSASLQYSYTDEAVSGAVPYPPVNLVMLGLRKTF